MRVTHNRDKSVPHYSLVPRGERLSSVSSVKDLGITISHDLSWTLHVVEVVNNRFCKQGNLFHIVKGSTAPPYLVKNIFLLEKVQRRASRLALGQRRGEMSYEDRCEMLVAVKWWSQLTACSTSRNTGTPEHPGTPKKPGTPPKTRNTPPENPEHPQKTRNTPQKTRSTPRKLGTSSKIPRKAENL